MQSPSEWHIRPRYWFLVAVTLLLLAGIQVANINWQRMESYRSRCCHYEEPPWQPCTCLTISLTMQAEPDGRTRIIWPDESYEIGLENVGVRTGLWQCFDARGVLRQEEQYENGGRSGPCRYYDAEGRLRVEGLWYSTPMGRGRTGIWTVYDIVGDGPRWIAFFE